MKIDIQKDIDFEYTRLAKIKEEKANKIGNSPTKPV